jgi:hypothetical protein
MLDLREKTYSVSDESGFTDMLFWNAAFDNYEISEGGEAVAEEDAWVHKAKDATVIVRFVDDPDQYDFPADAQITVPGVMVELRQGAEQETTAIRFSPGVEDPRSRTEIMLYAEIFRGIYCGHTKEETAEIIQNFVLDRQTLKDFGTAAGLEVPLPKSSVLPHQWKDYANRVHQMAYGVPLGEVTENHTDLIAKHNPNGDALFFGM